ncbi:MAG: hypothetical protein Aurels2KO_41180 [Aureliella sp.]
MKSSSRAAGGRKTGSTLVAVLVVLAVVGMLSAHTFQTLMLIRQSENNRAASRQNLEIVELAKHVAESEAIQSSRDTVHETRVEVQDGKWALITIQLAKPGGADQLRDYHIAVQYPVKQNVESEDQLSSLKPATSTWETDGWAGSIADQNAN